MHLDEEKDEAENLREACALGNYRAAKYYLEKHPALVNTQNKMNKWTALHWASSRGHLNICALLVDNGALKTLKNIKDQTPLDIAKSDEVKTFLSGIQVISSVNNKEENLEPFIPNYLKNPDLAKTWTIPVIDNPLLQLKNLDVTKDTITFNDSAKDKVLTKKEINSDTSESAMKILFAYHRVNAKFFTLGEFHFSSEEVRCMSLKDITRKLLSESDSSFSEDCNFFKVDRQYLIENYSLQGNTTISSTLNYTYLNKKQFHLKAFDFFRNNDCLLIESR